MAKTKDFSGRAIKGPGKKAKKQKPPEAPKKLTSIENGKARLGSRAHKRMKKREVIKAAKEEAKKIKEQAKQKAKEELEESTSSGSEAAPEESKLSLFEDSASESEAEDQFVDDASSSDDEDVERSSRRLQRKQQKTAEEAQQEMMETSEPSDKFVLPAEDEKDAADIGAVKQRITDVMKVLTDFNNLRQEGRSRVEYVNQLRSDLCLYYSYNDYLMEKLMDIFNNEIVELLEANEVERPVTIRTNSLKARRRDVAQALINRGMNLDPVGKWSKVGLVIYDDNRLPVGATPEYLGGQYMLQGASSMLPVMALEPREHERVLDLAAAPGGKTTHIASLMRNTGLLVANDPSEDRARAVVGNLHRMGVSNTAVTVLDGRSMPQRTGGFDRVLLDAPCSGTGVIPKDPSVKASKDDKDIQRCSHLQRELLLAAIDCCDAKSKTGAVVVYSTCSVLVDENESVVEYALARRNVKLVDTGLDFGTEGFTRFKQNKFHPTMKLTKRFYPHTHNMDGFFVAKLQKFSNYIPGKDTHKKEKVSNSNNEISASDQTSENESEDTAKGNASKKGQFVLAPTENENKSPKKRAVKVKRNGRQQKKTKRKASLDIQNGIKSAKKQVSVDSARSFARKGTKQRRRSDNQKKRTKQS